MPGRELIFEELVASRSTARGGEPRHAWHMPSPVSRPRVTARRPHEWAVPAILIRVVNGNVLLVEADLGWHQRVHTHVHLYGIHVPQELTAGAVGFIKSVVAPGDTVTVVSHRMLDAAAGHHRVIASVTLPDGRDLSTLLLGGDHARPGLDTGEETF